MEEFYLFLRNVLKKNRISVNIYELFVMVRIVGNRSLMDRTPDSDSGNAGSIPAGCIKTETTGLWIGRK